MIKTRSGSPILHRFPHFRKSYLVSKVTAFVVSEKIDNIHLDDILNLTTVKIRQLKISNM